MRKILLILFLLPILAYSQCPTPARTVRMQGYTAGADIYRPSTAAWQPGDTIKITPTTATVLEIYGGGGNACNYIIIVANTTFTTPVIRFKGGAKFYKIVSTGAGTDTTTARNITAANVACDGADHS